MSVARIVKIGGISVGLVGLDAAIAKVKASDPDGIKDIDERALEVLSALEEKNYIPASARDAYVSAIKGLLKGVGGGHDSRNLSIRILGPGCVSCNRLEEIVRSVLDQKGIAADIEHVKDLDEIWRYGVMNTPALVINERVLCSGRLPTRHKIEEWLQQILCGSGQK